MKTFWFAYFQVFSVSINVYFISIGDLLGVGITSFILNVLWMYNVNSTAKRKTIWYPIGATLGAVSGVMLGRLIM
jgi:hypothetical protein